MTGAGDGRSTVPNCAAAEGAFVVWRFGQRDGALTRRDRGCQENGPTPEDEGRYAFHRVDIAGHLRKTHCNPVRPEQTLLVRLHAVLDLNHIARYLRPLGRAVASGGASSQAPADGGEALAVGPARFIVWGSMTFLFPLLTERLGIRCWDAAPTPLPWWRWDEATRNRQRGRAARCSLHRD
jgi:hypothetical protein